jgi:hypothetical protein
MGEHGVWLDHLAAKEAAATAAEEGKVGVRPSPTMRSPSRRPMPPRQIARAASRALPPGRPARQSALFGHPREDRIAGLRVRGR